MLLALSLSGLVSTLWAADTVVSQKQSKLARIAVFHLLNETKRKDLDFLEASIADSIVKSMSESLIFEMPNRERNQKISDLLIISSNDFTSSKLAGLCATTEVDYAIYGNIVKGSNGQLKVYSGIYSVRDGKIVTEIEKNVSSNSRMLDKILDKVA